MTHLDMTSQTCITSLKLLGDFHILRIIDVLQDGPARFCNIQRQLNNLNPVTLTDRLKKLEQAGIVDRREDDENSVHYSLTTTGRAALPVIDAIDQYSNQLKP